MGQCEATVKRTGRVCGRSSLSGQRYCRLHQTTNVAPGPAKEPSTSAGNLSLEGLYTAGLNEHERQRFLEALAEEGLDREIALIRTLIDGNLAKPDLIQKWVDLLIKGVNAKQRLSKKNGPDPFERLVEVFRGYGEQLLPKEEERNDSGPQSGTDSTRDPESAAVAPVEVSNSGTP